ncbi:MAG: hypothetical protein K8F54_08985 [Altibacter sp.]|uniref:hypothetical protein n=1 Tax=Altibacter sp. TaxID=2024823 RepID=UPI001D5179D6|nr:hypothetical protein [Altibacter sp.]MBZ0327724.1 hypothetical protein [Altibacter sp.]
MRELDSTSVESSEFVEQTFNFWFNGKNHIRSPFPEYIRSELKILSVKRFFEWTSGIDPKAKEEVNDQVISAKFEEFIFDIAQELVRTEDEKLTIKYPFMPRIGDEMKDDLTTEKSIIVNRSLFKKKDDQFMKVKLQKQDSNEIWETSFELPI